MTVSLILHRSEIFHLVGQTFNHFSELVSLDKIIVSQQLDPQCGSYLSQLLVGSLDLAQISEILS